MRLLARVIDWVDARTGLRAGRAHLLDEPLPSGTGWWFVSGSVVLFLLGVQFATGIVLAMYYVPSPEHAYDSVRFVMERVMFGHVLRGLHVFGASFIVVAALLHMGRVVLFGSYKAPRELTWILGVILLLIILAFALTGYLLPWDQKAYWATTVTINIARSGPFGEYVAGLMQGGTTLGALTLLRWYAAHVLLLPICVIGFVVAHLYLMRRHGISGPIVPKQGPSRPFYPYQAFRDTLANAAVFAALVSLAVLVRAPLEPVADPTDATYVPRPEWYFLSLFQLLKYFPGPLEPVATIVIPVVVVGTLFLLPWLDRRGGRHPRTRPLGVGMFVIISAAAALLTVLGLRDSPARTEASTWGPVPLAGMQLASSERCSSCHRPGGPAAPVATLRVRRDPAWLLAHLRDPEVIAPGIREAPPGGLPEVQARAVLSYLRRSSAGDTPPSVPENVLEASLLFGRVCAGCHVIDGEGGDSGPDLSRVGGKRDQEWLRSWIAQPEAVDPAATMPAFGDRLSTDELTTLARYLSLRQ